MKRQIRFLSKVLVLVIVLTSIGYTNPIFAEEVETIEEGVEKKEESLDASKSLEDKTDNKESRENSLEVKEPREEKPVSREGYGFNPDDWTISKEDDTWTLIAYGGSDPDPRIYIPAIYDDNGSKVKINIGRMRILRKASELIIEEVDGRKVKVNNSSAMSCFSGNEKITKVDLSGLDTRNIDDMSYMFRGCTNLREVNLSGLDTSSMTTMISMFFNCKNLSKINLTNFTIKEGVNTRDMFLMCNKLSSIYFSDGDLNESMKVLKNISNKRSVVELDLSNTVIKNVDELKYILDQFTSLKELNLSGSKFEGVTSLESLFFNRKKISKLDLSNVDASSVKDMNSMFQACLNLEEVNLSGLDTSSVTNMSNMFVYSNKLSRLDLSSLDTSKVDNMSSMFLGCSNLKDINLIGIDTSNVEDMSKMFAGCSSLEEIDLTSFNTAKVKNMSSMFSECKSLVSPRLENLNTLNVEDMSGMFNSCSSLEGLDVSSFETSNVKDMSSMFNSCSGLKDLDISNFDTSSVKDMSSMFESCTSLKNLDIGNLDTSNVVDMSSMFRKCKSLNSVDISKLNTSSLVDMSLMFAECESFVEADLSKIDTSKVENMESLFASCINLKNVNMSGLDASKVKDMNRMFSYCVSLRDVNMKNIKISSLEDISHMFEYCVNLKDLDLSSFSLLGHSDYSDAIKGCINLESLDISNFKTGLPLGYEIDLRENNPFGTNRKLKKLTLPKIVRGEELKGLLAISSIDYIDLDIEKDAGHLGDQNFYQPDNNWYIEGLDIGFQELLEDQLINFIDFYYEGDEYKDILVEKDILTIEELESISSTEDLVDKIYEKLNGLTSYEDKERIFNVMEEVYELEVYELISQDDTNGLNTIIGDIQMIDILKRSSKYMEKGYPLLITTNNLKYFEEYKFDDDNRIPMELGPMLDTGEQSFKTGGKVDYIYKNDRIVYGEGELENLKITKEMLDELVENVDLEGNDGKKIRIKGVLDGDQSISLEDLVGRSILDEKDKTYTLEYEEVPEEVSYKVNFIVDGKDNIVEVKEGSRVLSTDLPPTEKPGYNFVEWNSKEDGSGDVFDISKPVEKDMVFYAIYKSKPVEKPEEKPVVKPEVSYRVNFIVDGRDNIVKVKEGSKLLSTSIPSTEKPGYDFVEWNSKEDGSGDVFDISKPVERDMVFYAIYKEKPVVKPEEKPVVKPEVSYRVNFIVDGRDNIVKVKEGSRVLSTSIPPTEKPGYDFVEWNSKKDGSGDVFDISKPVEKNMVFYAIYKEKPVEQVEFDHLAYLKGYEDNTIRPLGQLTREETAMIFYRILDKKDINKNRKLSKRFPDVKRGSWSEEAIESLASLGILEGYEDGNFRPKDRITRGELATILAKISSMERVSTRFTDVRGHWAEAYIESIEAKGWIEGYKDGSFKPDVNIKRSELARMVNKYLGRDLDKEKVLAGVREFKDFNKLSDKKWYYKDLVEASNNHRGLTDNEIYTWKEIF